MQKRIVTTTLVLIIILLFASNMSQDKIHISELNKNLETTQGRLESIERQLSVVFENNEELANKLALEEEERKIFEEQQTTFTTDINEQFSILADEEATTIVKNWEPFVYQIRCVFDEQEDSAGSAIVESENGKLQFISNEHILNKYETLNPKYCVITKPKSGKDTTVKVLGEFITFDEEIDIGFGPISENIPAFEKSERCSAEPAIGDKVVIIGYPGIGASESITATEGIISGFTDEYYVTSAKIDKGNSGSAAIDVKNNCLLGMPTIVVPGKLESLARILPLKP